MKINPCSVQMCRPNWELACSDIQTVEDVFDNPVLIITRNPKISEEHFEMD